MLSKFLTKFRTATPSVVWFSHHIPKTAGTSLRTAFEKAAGKKCVLKVYKPADVKRIENGRYQLPSILPVVVHGHFKPDLSQVGLAPHVKRLVWLRDPVQRAWSLLKHMSQVQRDKPEFSLLVDKFGERALLPDEEVFEYFLENKAFSQFNRPYQNYFRKVGLDEFDFVGRVENFETDMQRLGRLMNLSLETQRNNVRKSAVVINSADYKHLLEREYSAVRDYYDV